MRTIANKQKAVGHWKEKWIFLQRVMVFLASSLCARVVHHTNQFFGQIERGPDRFWRRRRLYMMTAHLYGRSRNCFSVALRYNIRQLQHVRKMREARKGDARELWDSRVEGQANELNYDTWHMREALSRTGIALDRHAISTLALTGDQYHISQL